jgi:hypothetical protein
VTAVRSSDGAGLSLFIAVLSATSAKPYRSGMASLCVDSSRLPHPLYELPA